MLSFHTQITIAITNFLHKKVSESVILMASPCS